MKNMSLCLLTFSVVSCSHLKEETKIVYFPYAKELLQSVQKTAFKVPETKLEVEEVEGKSARRVYFSSLYHQYLTLGQHMDKNPGIKFCPQFHHDRTEVDATYAVPEVLMYKASNVVKEGRDYFPELAFTKSFSLKDHHDMMKKELKVLCEEGVSDNYYKFDNLVTHYANKKSFHLDKTAMESVLKIPVFANFYLVKMLQAENLRKLTFHPEEKRFIKMTRTDWFEKYVDEASKMRGTYIKNTMVKR